MYSELSYPRAWQSLAWVATLAIYYLSLMPSPPQPPTIFGWDKAQHAAAYFVLMLLFRQAFKPRVGWIFFVISIGVSIEWLQGFTDYRTPDTNDVIANSIGIIIALFFSAKYQKLRINRLEKLLHRRK